MAVEHPIPHDHSTHISQSNAFTLAEMRLKDPEHNITFDLFWKTQPEPEEVFSPDMWEDEHFDMLQSTSLVRRVVTNQRELIHINQEPVDAH